MRACNTWIDAITFLNSLKDVERLKGWYWESANASVAVPGSKGSLKDTPELLTQCEPHKDAGNRVISTIFSAWVERKFSLQFLGILQLWEKIDMAFSFLGLFEKQRLFLFPSGELSSYWHLSRSWISSQICLLLIEGS